LEYKKTAAIRESNPDATVAASLNFSFLFFIDQEVAYERQEGSQGCVGTTNLHDAIELIPDAEIHEHARYHEQ